MPFDIGEFGRGAGRQYVLPLADGLIVDLFAGGGGMSVAIEEAFGRHADIAINHNDDALSLHRVNHPQTRHLIADVFEVDPRGATQGRRVAHLHLSPDCTHHSQAKGGQPRDRKIRALAWVGVRWCGQVRPATISLENVKQFRQWGPLIAKRDPVTGRVVKLDGSVAAPGERVPLRQQHLVPDPKRLGETYRRFVSCLEGMGYEVRDGLLMAADFGAKTTRERLFMFAACDGAPVVFPEPTHSKTPTQGVRPWGRAADAIDWSIPVQSIFGRKKALADGSLRRIAHGVKRYVLDHEAPFIAPIHSGTSVLDQGSSRGSLRSRRKFVAFMAQHNTMPKGGVHAGHDMRSPLSTVTHTGSQQALVMATMASVPAGGLVDMDDGSRSAALRCASFLIRYYGSGGQWGDLRDPAHSITTIDRLALVTVWIDGERHLIVDIGLRMLTPRELFRAQGFPESYVIDRGHDGRIFPKRTQVRLCGNSVSPYPAYALLRVNQEARGDLARRVAA